MKNWIRHALVASAATAALAGSIAAYSQGAPAAGFHHGPPTPEDMAAHQAQFLAHIGKKLQLDANQQAKLAALAGVLKTQHETMAANDPHARMLALIAGNTFDRAGAQQLVNEKVTQIQAGAPALIAAAGDFFDSLNATQQQQVRDFAAKHHGPGEHRGPWGHHGPASAPAATN
jgi:periplasmic protein CpxP/Spy